MKLTIGAAELESVLALIDSTFQIRIPVLSPERGIIVRINPPSHAPALELDIVPEVTPEGDIVVHLRRLGMANPLLPDFLASLTNRAAAGFNLDAATLLEKWSQGLVKREALDRVRVDSAACNGRFSLPAGVAVRGITVMDSMLELNFELQKTLKNN